MIGIKLIFKLIPWVLAIVFGILLYLTFSGRTISEEKPTNIRTSAIISQIESLGKLELVKYNLKEITELNKEAPDYFYKLIQLGPPSKMALISSGSAVGCVDLTRLDSSKVRVTQDTIFIQLPPPELCYFKLDMEETRIYSLSTNPLIDRNAFIQAGYKAAEQEIKNAALRSGILEQTATNAELVLKPMLERIAGKPVVFVKQPTLQPLQLEHFFPKK